MAGPILDRSTTHRDRDVTIVAAELSLVELCGRRPCGGKGSLEFQEWHLECGPVPGRRHTHWDQKRTLQGLRWGPRECSRWDSPLFSLARAGHSAGLGPSWAFIRWHVFLDTVLASVPMTRRFPCRSGAGMACCLPLSKPSTWPFQGVRPIVLASPLIRG